MSTMEDDQRAQAAEILARKGGDYWNSDNEDIVSIESSVASIKVVERKRPPTPMPRRKKKTEVQSLIETAKNVFFKKHYCRKRKEI